MLSVSGTFIGCVSLSKFSIFDAFQIEGKFSFMLPLLNVI